MAAGGSGDVLTGIVAALLAAQVPAFEAAGLAAYWHGAAADRGASAEVGFGLLASELADALPSAAAQLMSKAMRGRSENQGKDDGRAELDLRFPGS